MKPDQDDWLGGAEIVGEIENPVLETVRRFWWRGSDRLCGCFVSFRLWLFDRLLGPEPSAPANSQREADHERIIQALSAAGRASNRETRGPR